jgi:hypothetical protein
MMYKKIERTLDEIFEFFDKISWNISSQEIKVIRDCNYIDEYLSLCIACYDSDEYREDAQKVVNFFWEKVEEEPDYNSWIGEDCVFSDEAPDLNNIKKYICFLGVLTNYSKGENKNFRDNAYFWNYCMLKKDYVKLLKEQGK